MAGSEPNILIVKDVAYRVVAKGLPPADTPISEVMTSNPKTVAPDTRAMVALRTMVAGQFRHLPVVEQGEGIAYCSFCYSCR